MKYSYSVIITNPGKLERTHLCFIAQDRKDLFNQLEAIGITEDRVAYIEIKRQIKSNNINNNV